jgi:hypothetical protein
VDPRRTLVIDTNVLLSQPEVISTFHDADLVIPEMVLSEIDKLKTARVDPDLRYKGRQVSRILFEFSELGSLQEGLDVGGGSTLRVAGLTSEVMPPGLSSRNTDDRIVALAITLRDGGAPGVTVVTNDLNMLLKAQSNGLGVERFEVDDGFMRRFVIRPFQRYRIPLAILASSLAVFAAVVYLSVFSPFAPGRQLTGVAALPPEFVEQLSVEQQQVLGFLFRLQTSPKDTDTLIALATVYDTLSQQNINYLPYAIRHWEQVVALSPSNTDARVSLATDYFREHKPDLAIQTISEVLASNPQNVNANLVLGMFYMNTTPEQYQNAADRLEKVASLTRGDPQQSAVLAQAQTLLAQVKKAAATAGVTIRTSGSGL